MQEETHLLRQINPSFIQDGKITSQAFSPTPKDELKLSCYDGDLIEAPAAYVHFVEGLGLKSTGVLSVTMDECSNNGLQVRPDPEPFPEHAIIDFSGYSPNDVRRKAKLLRAVAEQRGWLFKP
ncbi:hypothetical protein N018_13135 [Pseudomonas syringae CC1557]|uniref:Uncharacterized protein n=1 Tax=Pseudomonas syringae CC1557 TaxID=1357279 RepID=W0MVP1_PSESX|nr:hypothetical protein [Pseudomonas syringae]AHG41103.1 hypothetical protein N018_13135 [Pseudomonas syringae CC1557]